ncbi:hypothetical protein LguiB_015548 [Lonicera macranthoides]
MAASVQYRQQEKSFGTAAKKENDDDLALFLNMSNIEDDRENHFLLQNSDRFDDSLGSEPHKSSISKMASTMASDKPPANGLLNSEDKSDYDWLLTPSGTPLFPSLEMDSQKNVESQNGISNGHSATSKSKLANSLVESTSKSHSISRQSVSSTGLNSSTSSTRRPPSNTSRSSTPAARPTSRASTPTSRSTLPSTRSEAPQKRSSTPTRPSTRSSTPSTRPSILTAPKSTSRSSTPARKPSTPSSLKSGAKTVKNPVPPRGTSPTVKSRPQKDDSPSNLRSSIAERPLSASKGRPSVPSAQSSTTNNSCNGRQRRQSCSPSRVRAQSGSAYNNMRSVIAKSRGCADNSDDVNPVLMGTQMVERVVNMRKLAPPKQDDYLSSNHNNSSGKSSSSQDSSGFGRSLSKKSFDMALRHMDIRRSIPGNLRSLMTNVPASLVYSVRSGSTKSTTVSVSDSPLATSSTTSSELSFNNYHCLLDGCEVDDNDR